jgi:hypothetical protein
VIADDTKSRPTRRPPARVRHRPPHPNDGPRLCRGCGVVGDHFFEGAQILPAADVGADGGDVWEAWTVTCAACGSSVVAPHEARPELDGDSVGWVTARREAPAADIAAIVAMMRGAA